MDGLIQPQPLDYAAPSPLKQRIWRRIGWTILVLLIGFTFIRIGPVAWRNAKLVHLQSQCLQCTASADFVVLSTLQPSNTCIGVWSDFHALLSSSGSVHQHTFFLHERMSGSGNRRLIVVEGAKLSDEQTIIFQSRVFELGNARRPPREVITVPIQMLYSRYRGEATVYAGQPDPLNGSHFTCRMISADGETIFDGWLRDDDTVLLEARPTQPLPSTAAASP